MPPPPRPHRPPHGPSAETPPRRAAPGTHQATAPRRRPRRLAAGQVIVVGVVCFGLWLLLDARELYHAASAGPLGTRRSVAMSLLRPIARADEAFSLDRIENGANRALGRAPLTGSAPGASHGVALASPDGPLGASAPAVSTTKAPPPGSAPSSGATSAPSGPSSTVVPLSAAHPLSVLVIGDSIGEDLGIGLTDVLATNRSIHVIDAATTDTGLADPAYFNWPVTLARLLRVDHPDIVVAMMGGNDWQPFIAAPNRAAIPGTAYWRLQYGARVAELINEASASGAKVFWVGLPIMSPDSGLPAAMAPSLNAVDASQSDALGATYIPSWNLFVDGEGQYAEFLPDSAGALVQVRDPDGIHLAPPAGCDLLARAVLTRIAQSLDVTF